MQVKYPSQTKHYLSTYIKVLSKSLYCAFLCFKLGHANLLQFINRVFDTTPQFRREKFLENEDEMHFTERSQLPMCYSTVCLCREKGMEIPGQWFSGMWPSQNAETSAELKVSNIGVKILNLAQIGDKTNKQQQTDIKIRTV